MFFTKISEPDSQLYPSNLPCINFWYDWCFAMLFLNEPSYEKKHPSSWELQLGYLKNPTLQLHLADSQLSPAWWARPHLITFYSRLIVVSTKCVETKCPRCCVCESSQISYFKPYIVFAIYIYIHLIYI